MKLTIRDIAFKYASTPIIENINMEVVQSELAVVIGPNGVGKSTLIRCINGILKHHKGSITLDGKEIKSMSMPEIARRIGYVSQASAEISSVTVFDMILMGRRPHFGWRSRNNDIEKVVEIMKLMDIEEFALRDFSELSGGEQQKVIISRALVQEPDILLLDEPTSSLDIGHQLEAMEIISDLVTGKGMAVIMAVHDLNLASRYADKVYMMKGGRMFSTGDPLSVLTSENISSVYGIESVVKNESGRPYIIPMKYGA